MDYFAVARRFPVEYDGDSFRWVMGSRNPLFTGCCGQPNLRVVGPIPVAVTPRPTKILPYGLKFQVSGTDW